MLRAVLLDLGGGLVADVCEALLNEELRVLVEAVEVVGRVSDPHVLVAHPFHVLRQEEWLTLEQKYGNRIEGQ